MYSLKKKKGYRKVQKYLLSAITFVAISLSQTQISGTQIWYKQFEQISFLFLEQTGRNTSPNLSSAPLYFSVLSKCNSCRTPVQYYVNCSLYTQPLAEVWSFSFWASARPVINMLVLFLLLPSHWCCPKCSAKIGGRILPWNWCWKTYAI